MRTIGVVTVGRSDYGIYVPILSKIKEDPDLHLKLYVTGMHMSKRDGNGLDDGIRNRHLDSEFVEMLLDTDSPAGIVKSMGVELISFGQLFREGKPDILLVLGDRYEMFSAAVSAYPFGIPIGHIHGGELTLGSLDEGYRHSMTKLSHLHFVSTKQHASRVIQLGEEPWRVTISGAPGLDLIDKKELLPLPELQKLFGLPDIVNPILATFHPNGEVGSVTHEFANLIRALIQVKNPVIFTQPNSDYGHSIIETGIRDLIKNRPLTFYIPNMGSRIYHSFMATSAVMVGNSSSGIIEAPSFELPVVNIGDRQEGRLRAPNVIDVEANYSAILSALQAALNPEFKRRMRGLENPYGDGRAAERIITVLRAVNLDRQLTKKRFHDLVRD